MNMTRESYEKKTDEPRRVESDIPSVEPTEQPVHQFIDIHIYNEYPEDEDRQSTEETTGTIEATLQPAQKHAVSPLRIALIGAIILLVIGAGVLVFPLLFVQSETVTIIPTTKTVQTSATLIVDTRSPASNGDIPGRVLPALTMSQALTVATTGTTYQSAEVGRGLVTFYNSGTEALSVGVGTLITGHDGVQVATDYSITVPPANYPVLGQAGVSAHTVITGYSANIPANDIYGPCCLLNIEASNSAFSGGVPATTYQSVAQTDIDAAVSRLQTTLTQSVVAAYQTQVQSSETLAVPPICQPTINTDHQVGDKATQVQVTVSHTCTGFTYNTRAFQQRISQIQPIAHYRMLGIPQATLESVAQGNDPGASTLTVQSTALWVYQFTHRELATIATHIAGKDTMQATQYLLHTTGVRHVSFNSSSNLPSDETHIHFLFLTQQ